MGVFCYHQGVGQLLSRYSGFSAFNLIDNFGANYAVPLFFLVSGYCIHLSNSRYLKSKQSLPLLNYLKRRFLRIYPAYIFAIAFSFLVNNITGSENHTGIADIFIHLFLLQGFVSSSFSSINLVLWTISVEFVLYLLYPIFYYIRIKYSLNNALLVAFIVSVISISFLISRPQLQLSEKYFVFNIWFAWCCGAFLADKKMLNPTDLAKPMYKILYTILLIIAIMLYYKDIELVSYQLHIILWAAPMMFIISKENWLIKHRKPLLLLEYVGLSSYSLYLLHQPLILLKNFLVVTYIAPKYAPLAMGIGFAIIPLITWYCYKIIEEPFMKSQAKSPALI